MPTTSSKYIVFLLFQLACSVDISYLIIHALRQCILAVLLKGQCIIIIMYSDDSLLLLFMNAPNPEAVHPRGSCRRGYRHEREHEYESRSITIRLSYM